MLGMAVSVACDPGSLLWGGGHVLVQGSMTGCRPKPRPATRCPTAGATTSTHRFKPHFWASFLRLLPTTQSPRCFAVPRGSHHAARCFVLIGVLSALLWSNWGFFPLLFSVASPSTTPTPDRSRHRATRRSSQTVRWSRARVCVRMRSVGPPSHASRDGTKLNRLARIFLFILFIGLQFQSYSSGKSYVVVGELGERC